MASASTAARLCALACRRTSPLPRIQRTQRAAGQCLARRAFSGSPARWAPRDEEPPAEDDYVPEKLELKQMTQSFAEKATTEHLQHLDQIAKENGYNSIDDYVEGAIDNNREAVAADRDLERKLTDIDIGPKPDRDSIWYDEEDPETSTEDPNEFNEDDITTMGHDKLNEIKDMRHYARLTIWEMPLLSNFAKPFEPPKEDEVFRWRFTTYMGEAHVGERKVVLQFAPDDLKLTAVQTNKLKKLAGARYNPETELVKMSCGSFDHQAQNKRYLSNLADDLVVAAKDPADTFEDVPLDTRHHPTPAKPRFPPEWRMTAERRRQLNEHRERLAQVDAADEQAGRLVNGQKLIDDHLVQKMLAEQEREKAAEMVAAPSGGRGSRGSRARR